MDMRSYWSLLALTLVVILTWQSSQVEACSCMPEHPQGHYCQADYVIMVRVVRKSTRLVANSVAYKVHIKKAYKMTPAAHKMLKHGRLLTTTSTCGIDLNIGELYVIAGRDTTLNMCHYTKEYLKMSAVERRGFSGAYRKGCQCKVKPCFSNKQCLMNRGSSATGCMWYPFGKCESQFSACIPMVHKTPEGNITKCDWAQTKSYKACNIKKSAKNN